MWDDLLVFIKKHETTLDVSGCLKGEEETSRVRRGDGGYPGVPQRTLGYPSVP